MSNTNLHDLSVVIATLGETSLKLTIESINNGSVVPKEILICVPEEYAKNLEIFSFSNVKILTFNFITPIKRNNCAIYSNSFFENL